MSYTEKIMLLGAEIMKLETERQKIDIELARLRVREIQIRQEAIKNAGIKADTIIVDEEFGSQNTGVFSVIESWNPK